MSSVPSSLGLIMLIFFLYLYDHLWERTMVKSMHVIFNIFIMCVLSHSVMLTLCDPPWTVVRQAPLSVRLSSQEYWNELPCPFPGIKLGSLALQADSLLSEPPGKLTYSL